MASARQLSPVYQLLPVQHQKHLSLSTFWIAVQRTKEPLHAAYLNTPSPETRNCQSLLSSVST